MDSEEQKEDIKHEGILIIGRIQIKIYSLIPDLTETKN